MFKGSKIDVVDDENTVTGWLEKVKAFGTAQQKLEAAQIARARADSLPERLRRAEANLAAAEALDQERYDLEHWPETEARNAAEAVKKAERERLQAHLAKVTKEAAYDQNSPEIKERLARQAKWDHHRADTWEAFYVAEAEARANREPRPDEPNLPKLCPEWFATGMPTTRVLEVRPLAPAADAEHAVNANGHKVLEPQFRITYVDQTGLPTPEEQIAANAAKDAHHA